MACASGQVMCQVGNVLGFAQWMLGACPVVYCVAAGYTLGALSAAAYWQAGNTDQAKRQVLSTMAGGLTAPLGGRIGYNAVLATPGSKFRKLPAARVGRWAGEFAGGWAGGVPFCGLWPTGCDEFPAEWYR
jgi:hypothetical protein